MQSRIVWMQRRDAEYYDRAIRGHDQTNLMASKSEIQRDAAKASAETRKALMSFLSKGE